MQAQDYLPFFQDLLWQCYQFAVNNPINAGILAVAVWLLTSIFYSIRIGFLQKRTRGHLKAIEDAQSNLAASQEQVQQLQEDITLRKQQLQQENQRSEALLVQLTELSSHLTDGILALAANPDLGQQGLTVSPGLQAEQLWQRYRAAVQQVGQQLITQRQSNSDLQQANQEEAAKLAEKNVQLQALQLRFDNQQLQFSKLEAAIEEQKTILQQQQEAAAEQLQAVEVAHQAELARLEAQQQRTQAALAEAQARQIEQAAAVKTVTEVASAPAPQPVAVGIEQVQPAPAPVVAEPVVEAVTPLPNPVVSVADNSSEAAAEPEESPESAAVEKSAGGGLSGKFKSFFPGIKKKPAVAREIQIAEIEAAVQAVNSAPTPVINEVESIAEVAVQPVVAAEPVAAEKPGGGGIAGKFKSFLPGGKKKPEVLAAQEQPIQPEPVSPEPRAVIEATPAPTEAAASSKAEKPAGGGKLGGLFGNVRQTLEKLDQKFGVAAPVVPVEEEAVAEPAAVEPEAPGIPEGVEVKPGQLVQIKNLLGRFKK